MARLMIGCFPTRLEAGPVGKIIGYFGIDLNYVFEVLDYELETGESLC